MRITPRKSEVESLVRILQDDSYASPEAMAKDLFKSAYSSLLERDWEAFAHRFDTGLTIAWGPFSSTIEAERFGRGVGLGGVNAVVKLHSPARAIGAIKDNDKGIVDAFCTTCDHPAHTHFTGGCALRNCQCQTFRKEAA